MQRRRGRGGRRRPLAAKASLSFPVDGSSSSSDEGGETRPGPAPVAIVAAAAAGSAARAEKLAKRRKLDVAGSQNASQELMAAENVANDVRMESSVHENASGGTHEKPEKARESRYIAKLVEQAEVRKNIADAALERRLAREREKEDALYGDKERFVTSAYKLKLKEREAAEQSDASTANARPVSGLRSDASENVGLTLLLSQKARKANQRGPEDAVVEAKPSVGSDVAEVEGEGTSLLTSNRHMPRQSLESEAMDGEGLRRPEAEVPPKSSKESMRSSPVHVRGLRRNDAASIEAYRKRYFARLESRQCT